MTADRWTVAEVARHLGVSASTVRAYAARGQMPPPDGRLGRTPWWRPATITGWRGHGEKHSEKSAE